MKERRLSTDPEYLIPPVYDADGVQVSAGIGVDGKEYGDPVPMSPPIGYEPPSQLEELIESLIHRRDFQRMLAKADFETPDEADDFDVDDAEDDRFPETIYEKYFEAKSKRAADQAARQEASRKASVGSVSEVSPEKTAEKPISVSGSEGMSDKPPAIVVGDQSKSPTPVADRTDIRK